MAAGGRADTVLPPLELEGISIRALPGWEVRIRLSSDIPGATVRPVLHAATIPLPRIRGDYGSGVVERLGPEDAFVSLVEFGSEAAYTNLFKPVSELPRTLAATDLKSNQLERIIPGQGGVQRFFTYNSRPFCLYTVVGSMALKIDLAGRISDLLDGLDVQAPGPSEGTDI